MLSNPPVRTLKSTGWQPERRRLPPRGAWNTPFGEQVTIRSEVSANVPPYDYRSMM